MRIFFLAVLLLLLLRFIVKSVKKNFSIEEFISKWWMDFLHEVGEDKIKALVFKDLSDEKRRQFVVALSHICWKMYVNTNLEESVKRFTEFCKSMQEVRDLMKDNGLDDDNEALVNYVLELIKS